MVAALLGLFCYRQVSELHTWRPGAICGDANATNRNIVGTIYLDPWNL
uniref:Uncharacterized protein n=1 Tax=Setaria italica TaxID=4555 RepID=K3Z263_SETIT